MSIIIYTSLKLEQTVNPILGIVRQYPRIISNKIVNNSNKNVFIDKITISIELWFIYVPVLKKKINKYLPAHSEIIYGIPLRELDRFPSFINIRTDIITNNEKVKGDVESLNFFRTTYVS